MSHPTPTADLLHAASQRLVRTVDALAAEQWREPSLLPGWTLGHVVAHLALNAEGLAGALVGVVEGEPVTMYRSQQDRDADIAALGTAPPDELRDRLMSSVARLAAAITGLPDELRGAVIERTPGSAATFHAGAVPWMRLREVEIHHADLGRYSPAQWPEEFTVRLLEHRAGRWSGPGFTAVATDLGRSFDFGTPERVVTGPAHVLAWWSTGRPPYPGTDGPTSDDGELPVIEGM